MALNYMSIAEFKRAGYLQEVNRCFLHPLGLALAVESVEPEGEWRIVGVVDYRDDPEGMFFGDGDQESLARAIRIARERNAKAPIRQQLLQSPSPIEPPDHRWPHPHEEWDKRVQEAVEQANVQTA